MDCPRIGDCAKGVLREGGGGGGRSMKERFIDWNPNRESKTRLAVVGGIVQGYADENITLTLRQLYYQLVAKAIIPNSQREYKRLGDLLSKARLAGLIDWDAIEDRARVPVVWRCYDSVQQCVEEAADGFALQRWKTQPEYVELWCEKDALSSVLRPICAELFVTLMVNRGYSSSSAMYESRNRIQRKRLDESGNEREVHVLYLGDFDPSGEDMVRDIRDRFEMFGVEDMSVTKVALNPDQVSRWKLPPNPAKMSDSRAAGFVEEHGGQSYEVDAIPPKDLQRLVRESIKGHMDMDLYREILGEEQALEAKLKKAIVGIR
jgi:hypothetical protein